MYVQEKKEEKKAAVIHVWGFDPIQIRPWTGTVPLGKTFLIEY